MFGVPLVLGVYGAYAGALGTMVADSSAILDGMLVGFGIPFLGMNLFGNLQNLRATGDVVLLDSSARVTQPNMQPSPQVRPHQPPSPLPRPMTNLTAIDAAVFRAAQTIIQDIPQDSTIAILNISSSEHRTAEHVIDELELRLFETRRFRIVNRGQLEQIRREQNFHLSGEVSDDSAISIGNLLGASIVITGNVGGVGANQRLVLRALDVRTGLLFSMAREDF